MPGQLGGFALAMRVHEAFLRLHKTLQRDEQITSPRAYITTLAIRLIIDQIRSARARRERYIGEGLPEPVSSPSRRRPSRPRPSTRCRWRSS